MYSCYLLSLQPGGKSRAVCQSRSRQPNSRRDGRSDDLNVPYDVAVEFVEFADIAFFTFK